MPETRWAPWRPFSFGMGLFCPSHFWEEVYDVQTHKKSGLRRRSGGAVRRAHLCTKPALARLHHHGHSDAAAFFTPAAIPGLTLGCLLYNVSWAQALPLDWLVGSLATLLATACMWALRKVRIKKCPFLGLLMPAVWNAPLVGWELAAYLGEGGFTWPVFGLNALYVFLGEAIVLLVLGTILYYALTARKLDQRLFSPS